MAFAQGRASSYVPRDIGPIIPGRWQFSQRLRKIGLTSRVYVTDFRSVASSAGARKAQKRRAHAKTMEEGFSSLDADFAFDLLRVMKFNYLCNSIESVA